MTEELKTMLMESLSAENGDDGKYEMMACMAEREGYCEMAGVLRDIAHEETTHARLVKEMLDWGGKKK